MLKMNLTIKTDKTKLMLQLVKRPIVDLVIIIISVSYFYRKLFHDGLPIGCDILIPITWMSYLSKYKLWFSSWVPLDSFGTPHPFGTPFNPILFLLSFISNEILSIKIYIYVTFLLAGLSMYYFTYHHSKHLNASLFSAFIFMFNPVFLSEIYEGHHAIIFGYAFSPILFVTYDIAMRTGKIRDIALSAIMLFILFTCGDPQTMYIFCSFLILFTLLEVALPRMEMRGRLNALKQTIKVSLLTFSFFTMLSAHQLLPIIFGIMQDILLSAHTLEYVIEDAYFYSESAKNILYLFIPLLASSVLIFMRDRLKFFLSMSALISTIIAIGPFPPFGEIFIWMFVHVPFFYIFRVPTRWLMMTFLSLAFLIGLAFDKIVSSFKACIYEVAHIPLKKISRIKRSGETFATFFLIWVIIGSGLIIIRIKYPYDFGVYPLPEDYVKSYERISGHSNDFRIISVPHFVHTVKTSWISPVEGGWVWDPILYSQAIHGKVVITGFGGMSYTRAFLNFVFWLIQHHQTDDLMKILGALNTKYVVLQPHPSYSTDTLTAEYQRAFFFMQKGVSEAYRQGNVIILKNEFWTPRIFATSQYGLVIGGLNVLTSLSEVDSFNMSEWTLIFLNPLNLKNLNQMLTNANAIILSEDGFTDLVIMSIKSGIRIKAVQYAFPSSNPSEHWISSKGWADRATRAGMLVMNGFSLMTKGPNEMEIPFDVNSAEEYDIWLRVAYGPDRGKLSVLINDSKILSDFVAFANAYSGFKWVKAGPIFLKDGRHILRLVNDGTGFNDIDEIVIVTPLVFKQSFIEMKEMIRKSSARIIYILEAENAFSYSNLGSWYIEPKECDVSNGYSLVYWQSGHSNKLSTIIFIPRDGKYMLAARVLAGPIGNLTLSVDDTYSFTVPCHSLEWGWNWVSLGPMDLKAGQYKIFVQSFDPTQLDEIILYSLREKENSISISDVFMTKSSVYIDYEQDSPTRYVVHVKASDPFFLMFSESYHPLWKAYVDGAEIDSIISYSFVNGFYIHRTGHFDIIIEFTGQRYVLIGGVISLSTFGVITAYFILTSDRIKLKRLKRSSKKEE